MFRVCRTLYNTIALIVHRPLRVPASRITLANAFAIVFSSLYSTTMPHTDNTRNAPNNKTSLMHTQI